MPPNARRSLALSSQRLNPVRATHRPSQPFRSSTEQPARRVPISVMSADRSPCGVSPMPTTPSLSVTSTMVVVKLARVPNENR